MKSIKLSQGFVAICDDVDYEFLNKWKWRVGTKKGARYAVRNETYAKGRRRTVYMHKEILNRMGVNNGKSKFLDGNGLNNARKNLEIFDQGGD